MSVKSPNSDGIVPDNAWRLSKGEKQIIGQCTIIWYGRQDYIWHTAHGSYTTEDGALTNLKAVDAPIRTATCTLVLDRRIHIGAFNIPVANISYRIDEAKL
jgi:hypothetical protein